MTIFTPNEATANTIPHILDSGARKEFETGAVRDIREGKGRCDLLPLDIAGDILHFCASDQVICMAPTPKYILYELDQYMDDPITERLYTVIGSFGIYQFGDIYQTLIEVSKHFEEGAKKYGDNNWRKGIPVHCYIDSAIRHFIKHTRCDTDEPHDRAFVWNLMCAAWTQIHKPEMMDVGPDKEIIK